ncbi:CCAAT/enhancer-binding protein beta-like [Patiria miniata]|uniref:BZIP domain-containing protein n=1 Tax=Patiria miniata TaxID=46514 RepID=A0A914ARD2_PATMI|nr:CCAAT/enhancer-binding protein beta-like [Patiria miniata]
MDSPGNFCMYDSEYYTEKELNKPDEVFLFGNEDSMNFGGLADYTGLFQNENSIDLNAYINPSTSPTDGFIQLSDLLPSSPPKSTIPTELPPLIRPEEAETSQSTSRHTLQHTSSPSVTVANLPDSMPSSHPQFMSHHQDCQEGAAALQVKVEPSEQVEPAEYYQEEEYDYDDDDASTYTSGPSRPSSPISQTPSQRGRKLTSKSSSSRRVRPIPDKDSEEYRQKRVKNNIAVRRSREKSKAKSYELQGKVKELTTENDRLNKRVELLTKELTVLKSLFTNVGKSAPPSLANM